MNSFFCVNCFKVFAAAQTGKFSAGKNRWFRIQPGFFVFLLLSLATLASAIEPNIPPATSSVIASGADSEAADEQRIPPEIRKLREMLKEGEAAFTEAEVDAFFRKIVPLVEKAAGRSFKKVPTWMMAERKTIETVLMSDILPQLENLLPNATSEQRQEFAQRQTRGMVPLLLGKYGFADKILYMLPRNFLPLFAVTKTKPDQVQGILQLIIAHELTHALQDQEIDLQKTLGKIRENEMGLAFNATIEGHAVYIMERVGHDLGLASSVIGASRLFAAGSVEFNDPALQILNKVMSMQFESIYLGGKRFIEFWVKKSGPEIVWDILKTPPLRTGVIMTPETYGASGEDEGVQIPLKDWLSGLEKFLGKPPVQVQNVEVGIMNLAAAWANMDSSHREELLAGIEKTQALIVVATATSSMGNVTLMVLKEADKAPMYIRYLEEMARENLKKLESEQSSIKVTGVKIGDFPGSIASHSRRFEFSIEADKQPPQKQVIFRFAVGHLLVEVFDGNVGISEAEIKEIARIVLGKYNEHSGKQSR